MERCEDDLGMLTPSGGIFTHIITREGAANCKELYATYSIHPVGWCVFSRFLEYLGDGWFLHFCTFSGIYRVVEFCPFSGVYLLHSFRNL